MRLHALAASALCALASLPGQAAPNADNIGKTLTAAGSSVEADGPIPRYEGREAQSSGWAAGKNRLASWKYRGDKPLYTIDATNVSKYAGELTPGQQALFKVNPDYKMDVYTSRRSCGFPDVVVENSKRNVKEAKLGADGNSLVAGVLPAVPFPGTQSGLEAIWNHLLRYQGVGFDIPAGRTFVSPRPGSDGWIDTISDTTGYYPLNKKGANKPTDGGGAFADLFVKLVAPAATAGQALVMRNAFGQQAETYFYFPGQRRVRRMPTYAYDSPLLGYENQLTVDGSSTFYGNPDRFDWKLTGEKNIIVPYNSFQLYDNEQKKDDVIAAKSLTQKSRRYELHKVYVVEASVKQGMRHTMPKRTFYLDADTYIALVADDYDEQGKLLKVRESYPIPAFEMENTCVIVPYVQYDVQNGRYFADGITVDVPASKAIRLYMDSTETRFKPDFYTQDNLRALSER